MMNKKGLNTIALFTFIIFAVFIIIFIGVYGLIFSNITNYLAVDIDVGGANLGNVTNRTLGQINTGLLDNLDTFGYITIFMMILLMFGNAYFTRGKYPNLMLIIDIFILIFAFILAVYMANTYDTLINASSFLAIYISTMPKSSAFILNMPVYVATIGIIIMIISYATLPKEKGEPNVEDFEY